jgi:hypothetical protein
MNAHILSKGLILVDLPGNPTFYCVPLKEPSVDQVY